MRRLTVATSIALTAAALAMPGAASAEDTAVEPLCSLTTCVEKLVDLALEAYNDLVTCPGGPACDPLPIREICDLIFPNCS